MSKNGKLYVVGGILFGALAAITWFNVNTYDEGEFAMNTLQGIAGACALFLGNWIKSE